MTLYLPDIERIVSPHDALRKRADEFIWAADQADEDAARLDKEAAECRRGAAVLRAKAAEYRAAVLALPAPAPLDHVVDDDACESRAADLSLGTSLAGAEGDADRHPNSLDRDAGDA